MSAVNELAPLSGSVLPLPTTLEGYSAANDISPYSGVRVMQRIRLSRELSSQEGVEEKGPGRFKGSSPPPPLSLPIRKTDLVVPPSLSLSWPFFIFSYVFLEKKKKMGVQVLPRPGDTVRHVVDGAEEYKTVHTGGSSSHSDKPPCCVHNPPSSFFFHSLSLRPPLMTS